ncbi:MAG: hypothetical protein ACYDC2_07740, partial [Solirubrobacteraceae bacterium]
PSVRSQGRLAVTSLYVFWPSRVYWQDVLGAALMPRWLTLRRYAPDSRSRFATVAPEVASVSLSGAIPRSVPAGGCVETTLMLENVGRRAVREAGPGAVTIVQRWLTEDGHPLGPTELALNEVASLPQSLPRRVRATQHLRFGFSLYPPPKPGRYRLELVAHSQLLGSLDAANPRARICAEVAVASVSRL